MPRAVQQNSADLNVVQEENGGRGYEVYNRQNGIAEYQQNATAFQKNNQSQQNYYIEKWKNNNTANYSLDNSYSQKNKPYSQPYAQQVPSTNNLLP